MSIFYSLVTSHIIDAVNHRFTTSYRVSFRDSSPLNCCRALNDGKLVVCSINLIHLPLNDGKLVSLLPNVLSFRGREPEESL